MNTSDQQLRVSVIIPTRNREDVLAECLDRLLAEPEPPFEIIVIDSSSSNTTQTILADYPTVINHRLGDVPYSMVLGRNIGLSRAQGELVAFIDDDCFVLPGWLRTLRQAFVDPNVVAAGGRVLYHPWKACRRGEPVAILDLDRPLIWAEWDRILDQPVDVPHLPGGNFAVRRAAALAINGFDTNFVGSANLEETDFFLRLTRYHRQRVVFLPDAVVEHRAAPRADGIERSMTNYLYRYSLIRNRLYFLRKHGAHGLKRDIRRQLSDAALGTARLLGSGLTFGAASLAGIVGGLLAAPYAQSQGLTVQPVRNATTSSTEPATTLVAPLPDAAYEQ